MMYDFLKKRQAPASQQTIEVEAQTVEGPVKEGLDEKLKGITPRFKAMVDRGKDYVSAIRQNPWVDELIAAGTGNVPLVSERTTEKVTLDDSGRVEAVPSAEAQAPAASRAADGADAASNTPEAKA